MSGPWRGDACSLVDAFRAGERSPVEELEAIYGERVPAAVTKEVGHLTPLHREYGEAAPLVVIAFAALSPDPEIWAHLSRFVLPEVVWNTAILVVGVGLTSGVLGTVLAWLTAATPRLLVTGSDDARTCEAGLCRRRSGSIRGGTAHPRRRRHGVAGP